MRFRTTLTFQFLVLAATVSTLFAAEQLPMPKVNYSADNVITTGEMTMTSRMYVTPNKQRMETSTDGGKSVIIMRMDKELSWVLMPEQKSYMEMSLAEGKKKNQDIYSCDSQLKSIGKETINGVATTKSSISSTCPEGGSYEGTIWVSKDGIMMRMDGTTKADGNEIPVRMELKNLKIGKQDPKLFEVPAGYTKFEMGGMIQGFQSIMKNAEQDAKRAEEQARKDEEQQRNKETGRSYTSKGRDYTSKGRSYTATKRKEKKDSSGSVVDPVVDEVGKKLKGWLGF